MKSLQPKYRRDVYQRTWATTQPKGLDEKQKAKAIELYSKHHVPVKLIAKRFGVAHETVRKVLMAAGVTQGCAGRRDE